MDFDPFGCFFDPYTRRTAAAPDRWLLPFAQTGLDEHMFIFCISGINTGLSYLSVEVPESSSK